jgi:hypothetical protein
MFKRSIPAILGVALLGAVVGVQSESTVEARIKLATLPDREGVVVRFDHPSQVLVEEERTLTLQEGVNNVDFSWAGTNIDKDSIVFRPVNDDSNVVILSTSYPPGEAALTWQIASPEARSEAFRLSYLMANIQRVTDYRAVVAADESSLTLRHYFRIHNLSGSPFDEADFITRDGRRFERALAQGEARRVMVNRWDDVKLVREYVYDTSRDSDGNVLTDFVLKNDEEHNLGKIALERGKVRLFQVDSGGTTAFIGEDWGSFTPIGDEMRLNIGVAQDIKIEHRKMVNERQNQRGPVYDTNEVDVYEIKNFKDEPAEVVLTLRVQGQWEMQRSSTGYESFERIDNETIKFRVLVPGGGEPHNLRFHYKRLNVW